MQTKQYRNKIGPPFPYHDDSGNRYRLYRYSKQFFRVCLVFLSSILFSCSFHTGLSRQTTEQPASFNATVFSRTLHLAEQLAVDDKIAWLSTDLILAEKTSLLDSLDCTWFVFDEGNRRCAFYGRYSDTEDTYLPKYAFVSEDGAAIAKIPPVAGKTVTRYAKAVTVGINHFKTIIDSLQLDINYNHYIRKSADGWYTMWFFPAGYGNYCAQGIEVRVAIDPAAGKVTSHQVTGTLLRYFELDKKSQPVELDNTYDITPSLGNTFFLLRNKERFASIRIINKFSTSTMVYSPDTGEWTWVHTPNQ